MGRIEDPGSDEDQYGEYYSQHGDYYSSGYRPSYGVGSYPSGSHGPSYGARSYGRTDNSVMFEDRIPQALDDNAQVEFLDVPESPEDGVRRHSKENKRLPIKKSSSKNIGWFKKMFPAETAAQRVGISLRIVVGVVLSLIVSVGPWFNAPTRCITPILTVVYAFQTPPYLGSAFMVFTIFCVGLLSATAASVVAVSLAGTYFDGKPTGHESDMVTAIGYLVIVGYWFLIIPPLRSSHLGIAATVLMMVVGVPVYIFQAFEDFLVTGIIAGINTAGVPPVDFYTKYCETLANQTKGDMSDFISTLEKSSLTTFIGVAACSKQAQSVFGAAIGEAKPECLVWDVMHVGDTIKQMWPQVPQDIIDYSHVFDGMAFCTVPGDHDSETILNFAMEPGHWLWKFCIFWSNRGAGPITWFMVQGGLAFACIFIMSFLPPARFATDRLRTLLRDQMLRLRRDRLPGCLPGTTKKNQMDVLDELDIATSMPQDPLPPNCSIGPTAGRKRLFAIDEPLFSAMDTVGALTTVEINFLDPGPFVAIWPSYRRIIPMIRAFSDQMVLTALLADLCENFTPDEPQERLVRTLDQLIFEMAFCLSLRPTAGGSAIFNVELLCIKLDEKCDQVRHAAAKWVRVTDAGTAEKQILFEGHRLAALQMAGSACALAEGIMTMMKVHSKPSWMGGAMAIFGVFLPTFALVLDIFKFWAKVISSPWTAVWKGDFAWWRDNRFAGVVQILIGLIALVSVPAFITSVRQLGELPVNSAYVWPGGRLGQWSAISLVVVLMTTWQGTVSRAPMRLITICIGAAVGLPALILLAWGRDGDVDLLTRDHDVDYDISRYTWARVAAVAYLAVVIFLCVFTSVDCTGRLAVHGAFHNQYGYGPYMIAYFSIAIATEGLELVTGSSGDQSAPYCVLVYIGIRVLENLAGVFAACLAATLWPVRAVEAAHDASAKALRKMSRALLTSIQMWRGDIVSPAAESECAADMDWCEKARRRANTYIMEMDFLGRGRLVLNTDKFFTLWAGHREDLPGLRTLHMDLTMFIHQFMKGCRAPITETPTFLEHLSYAVDEWAMSSARRITHISQGNYSKLQGLKTPTDEALCVFDALHKAMPDLLRLAQIECDESDAYDSYELGAGYHEYQRMKKKNKKKKKDMQTVLEDASFVKSDDGAKGARETAREIELARLEKENEMVRMAHLAEVELEADQRWQLLIALLIALETAIFSSLPDEPDLESVEDCDNPYAYVTSPNQQRGRERDGTESDPAKMREFNLNRPAQRAGPRHERPESRSPPLSDAGLLENEHRNYDQRSPEGMHMFAAAGAAPARRSARAQEYGEQGATNPIAGDRRRHSLAKSQFAGNQERRPSQVGDQSGRSAYTGRSNGGSQSASRRSSTQSRNSVKDRMQYFGGAQNGQPGAEHASALHAAHGANQAGNDSHAGEIAAIGAVGATAGLAGVMAVAHHRKSSPRRNVEYTGGSSVSYGYHHGRDSPGGRRGSSTPHRRESPMGRGSPHRRQSPTARNAGDYYGAGGYPSYNHGRESPMGRGSQSGRNRSASPYVSREGSRNHMRHASPTGRRTSVPYVAPKEPVFTSNNEFENAWRNDAYGSAAGGAAVATAAASRGRSSGYSSHHRAGSVERHRQDQQYEQRQRRGSQRRGSHTTDMTGAAIVGPETGSQRSRTPSNRSSKAGFQPSAFDSPRGFQPAGFGASPQVSASSSRRRTDSVSSSRRHSSRPRAEEGRGDYSHSSGRKKVRKVKKTRRISSSGYENGDQWGYYDANGQYVYYQTDYSQSRGY